MYVPTKTRTGNYYLNIAGPPPPPTMKLKKSKNLVHSQYHILYFTVENKIFNLLF